MKDLTVKNVNISQGQEIARDGNEFMVKKIIPDEEVFLHYHLYYLRKHVSRDRPVESTWHIGIKSKGYQFSNILMEVCND